MLIVKVGGGAAVDIEAIADDLATLQRPFVLLHGANHLRDQVAAAMGHPPRVVESLSGYSSVLSDDDAIDALMAAYAGIRNKRIVEALRRRGVDAIGLTGLDGGLVEGERNPGIRTRQDGKKVLLRDHSGKARRVNGALLRMLLDAGYAPVITVPIAGEDGSALNSENDDVLALLAGALGATDVVSLIEAPGLLERADDPASLVPALEPAELETWEERVDGRMRRKVRALRSLFDAPGETPVTVRLADGRAGRPVSGALDGAGTTIRATPPAGGPRASPTDPVAGPPGRPVPQASNPPNRDWLARQAHHELDVYGKRGLTLVEGRGARVRDADGREYIDCIGGHGALALGHCHPVLARALAEQAGRIWFVPGSFGHPERARFLEGLHGMLPPELSHTFLSNSGTEAVEAALKVARFHTGRTTFVAATGGFHGRTLGALSVTAEPRYRDPFEPLPGPVVRIPFNDVEALARAVDTTVAAVVLEPVQGEGGIHPADPAFLRAARRACDDVGALLVFDEVQTGFGRTGRMFAFEHADVVPDVLCLAKSIAGGLPLGATVVREGVSLPVGAHGSTFGGNPVACAVARATLEVLGEGDLLAGVETKGRTLAARVRDAAPAAVKEIRQIGLMVGVQLRVRARPTVEALQDRGVLALTAGTRVVRLLPPLVITDEEIRRVGDALVETLASA